MPDSQPTRRRSRLWVAVLMVVTLAAFPLGAMASHQFADVPDSNPFHNDIDAIADAGVTTGCGGGLYCPTAYVTREQMAAFMNRLGALAAEKTPVVRAATSELLDGYDANGINRLAFNSTQNLAAAGGAGSLTTTITAPGRGYLLISGFAELFNPGVSDDWAFCELQVDNNNVAGSDHYVDVGGAVSDDEQECSMTAGYQVCAGTYTVEMYVDVVGGTTALDATVTAEYIPFNGTGGIPSIFSCIIILPSEQGQRGVKAAL